MTDTVDLSERYCPLCEPERDPLKGVAVVNYCGEHTPKDDGYSDARVSHDNILSGIEEAGGDKNRVWCDLLHGRAMYHTIRPRVTP